MSCNELFCNRIALLEADTRRNVKKAGEVVATDSNDQLQQVNHYFSCMKTNLI